MRRLAPFTGALVLALVALAPRVARAEVTTFHLSVGDVLASVGRTNAFLASLGKNARGLKLVPGGTKFAGLTCAGFGDVYKLGAVTVLDGPQAFADLVTTKKGKDARSLATAFGAAGLTAWVPPASDAETDRQLWSAVTVPHGLRFVADALISGGDGGLLDAAASAGIFRFRADVSPTAEAGAPHRFLLEVVGRTASTDTGLVAFGEQRCFTLVDLVPVDVGVLERLVNERLDDPYVRNGLATRVATLKTALGRRDLVTALDVMAYIIGHLVARTPEHAQPADARRIVTGVFDVRRGLEFRAAGAQCGNGVRETGEGCDGADFGGFTCETVGYASGTLGCQPSCLFDVAQCVANPVCGNGILELNEECDAGAQNSDTAPDACRTTCKRAHCGDKVVDLFEDCEGNDLGGETCKTLGYDGGTLKCDASWCEFDEDRCTLEDE
ncbi:MAG: hypothetical protein IT293_07365 [Deltaproteobacteria bacterium]|nr:hypothetical protein [Deltaproteobacteria bacterium]